MGLHRGQAGKEAQACFSSFRGWGSPTYALASALTHLRIPTAPFSLSPSEKVDSVASWILELPQQGGLPSVAECALYRRG
jgi:hypothetical protein